MNFIPFFPETASESAAEVDRIAIGLTAVTLFFSVGIAVALLVLIVRFVAPRNVRRGGHPGPLVHWGAEIVWSIVPLGITIGLFVWGADVYVRTQRPPPSDVEIYVVGKQWMWKIGHQGGRREIDSLHVPTGRVVRLTMTSEDVIHSFFVPAFRLKQDVLPGRLTTMWFRATKPGRYRLFCAEYCGTEHSRMIGEVTVLPPEEYAQWVSAGDDATVLERGRRLLDGLRCTQCHDTGEESTAAPSLVGLFGSEVVLTDGSRATADAAFVRHSILAPAERIAAGYEPTMPSYEGQIEPEEIMQITAYLRSIADASGPLPGPGSNDAPRVGGPPAADDSRPLLPPPEQAAAKGSLPAIRRRKRRRKGGEASLSRAVRNLFRTWRACQTPRRRFAAACQHSE
jgi:cytochrome c oxidase subunit 2